MGGPMVTFEQMSMEEVTKTPFAIEHNLYSVPEIKEKIKSCHTFQQVIETLNQLAGHGEKKQFTTGYGRGYAVEVMGNHLRVVRNEAESNDSEKGIRLVQNVDKQMIVFFDHNGEAYYTSLSFKYKKPSRQKHQFSKRKLEPTSAVFKEAEMQEFKFEKVRPLHKLVHPNNIVCLQSDETLREILKEKSPHLYSFIYLTERFYTAPIIPLLAPQIEQLYKSGYHFVDEVTYPHVKKTDIDRFNRLCKPGKNLKEVFKCERFVYETLRDVSFLETWDSYRKIQTNLRLNKEEFLMLLNIGYLTTADLNNLLFCLKETYQDKKVFTPNKLLNYLNRLDMYEAIATQEALQLLRDYLGMCRTLEVEPNLDGDSLKREHDVMARTLRESYNEKLKERMDKSCAWLAQNNYVGEQYFIRGIESYDDLIDEAKQQHNCVASYANRIISKKSMIYVLRNKGLPEKSLATIELSPDQATIRQKFYAYNRPVDDPKHLAFLEEWMSLIEEKSYENYSSIEVYLQNHPNLDKQRKELQVLNRKTTVEYEDRD